MQIIEEWKRKNEEKASRQVDEQLNSQASSYRYMKHLSGSRNKNKQVVSGVNGAKQARLLLDAAVGSVQSTVYISGGSEKNSY